MQRKCFVVILFLLLGCKSLFPTHIQVFTGVPPVEREYRVLGPVEAEWREHGWTDPGTNNIRPWSPTIYYDEVNLALQQVAYTLFGDNADAIINVEYHVRIESRGYYRRGICEVRGTAIQYLDSPQVSPDHHITYMSSNSEVSQPGMTETTSSDLPGVASSSLCQWGESAHQVAFYLKDGSNRVEVNTAETQEITNDVLNLVRQFLTILQQRDFVNLEPLFTGQVRVKIKHLNDDPPDIDDFTVTSNNISASVTHNRFEKLVDNDGFGLGVNEFCRGRREPSIPHEEVMSEAIVANEELNRLEYVLHYFGCNAENSMTLKIRKSGSSLKISSISFIVGWIGCGQIEE